MIAAAQGCFELEEVIRINARAVAKAIDEDGLIGKEWGFVNREEIDLAQHLSGLMVLEMAAKLEKEKLNI